MSTSPSVTKRVSPKRGGSAFKNHRPSSRTVTPSVTPTSRSPALSPRRLAVATASTADGRRSAGPSPRHLPPMAEKANKYRRSRTQVEPTRSEERKAKPAWSPKWSMESRLRSRALPSAKDVTAHEAKVLSRPRPKLDLKRGWFARRCSSLPHDPLHATLVAPLILLGSKEAAASRTTLEFYGVTHVLNASAQVPNYFPDNLVYLHLPLIDSEEENIQPHFARAFAFIDKAHANNSRVLIHCVAGVSRSVTLAVAYIMATRRQRLYDVMRHVIRRRFIAEPNVAFRLALAEFELEIFGDSSVCNVKDKLWSFPDWNRRKRRVKPAPTKPTSGCSIM